MPSTPRIATMLVTTVLAAFLSSCAGPPENPSVARRCERGLQVAYNELDFAKANGFDGTVDWTKAASLLSAAKIQEEFGKYPKCIDTVRRARYYIRQSKR